MALPQLDLFAVNDCIQEGGLGSSEVKYMIILPSKTSNRSLVYAFVCISWHVRVCIYKLV